MSHLIVALFAPVCLFTVTISQVYRAVQERKSRIALEAIAYDDYSTTTENTKG